jgi:hypothetical protein
MAYREINSHRGNLPLLIWIEIPIVDFRSSYCFDYGDVFIAVIAFYTVDILSKAMYNEIMKSMFHLF